MAEPLADKIVRKIKQLDEIYHRLMLVVAPSGAGKTTALHDVRHRTCGLGSGWSGKSLTEWWKTGPRRS